MIGRTAFYQFFHAISDVRCEELSEIIGCVAKALSQIAEELKLGKILLDQRIALYSSEYGFNVNDCVEYRHHGMEGTEQKIMAWPCAGGSWTEEEKKDISFVLEMILVAGEREKLLHLIRRAEITDKLTGITNANGITEYGNHLCSTGEKSDFGVFFVNLRNFKLINKRTTPRGGDIVLKQFAEYISAFCSEEGEKAARMGGDNFLLIVRCSRIPQAVEMLRGFAANLYEGGQQIRIPVAVNAGYALLQEDNVFADGINKCSLAMTVAKRSSEDILAFEESMMEKMLQEKGVSEKFGKALANKEFVVFYQPKVDVTTKTLCGAEALVRWISQGDIIPPGSFIPVLEREGSIVKLDYYMLEAVCRHISQWIQTGVEPVCISVNFSKVHMKNPDTAKNIIRIVRENEVPPHLLEIELTEMSDFEDFITMKRFVAELKKAGIGVSIDDFGTGYSSLTLLRDLPVDTVKLDRSFVINLESGNEKDQIMLQAVTRMVRDFGMKVLVEGVETRRQFDYLEKLGCEVIQGYLFDKPMPLPSFRTKLARMRNYTLAQESAAL